MLRLIVAGGRDFDDYNMLEATLDYLLQANSGRTNLEPVCIICGMAYGADMLGRAYAQKRGYECREYPAKWEIHGKRAGLIRNEQMAQNADALIAFWDGESHGTRDMIDRAKRHGLETIVVRYERG